MSRWSDIILARRGENVPEENNGGPWGPWYPVPSTAGVLVRVRRARITQEGERELYAWSYEFKSQLPRAISFQYKVHPNRDGPFDRVVRRIVAGEVVRGSVILPTSGPVWIDARLIG
ncbi:MAG: hypothetical protein IPF77_06615 [Gemmatimonadetes bacterium]|nr:hypothetical protein [Gemmatimonadota bacterium]